MEYSEIIIAGIGILSVVVTHLLDRRKFKVEVSKLSTEVQGDTIGNMDRSLDFYEKWVENTNKRLDEVLQNQDKLIEENASLRKELNTVKEQTTKMSTLLCTNLPCNQRIVDSSITNCIYLNSKKKKYHHTEKKDISSEVEN